MRRPSSRQAGMQAVVRLFHFMYCYSIFKRLPRCRMRILVV
jgi:hypothetical protein